MKGVVGAMGVGNHDPDYGAAEFARCRALVQFPILSANTEGFQRYDVFTRHGIRIGVFAVAGPDFTSLVKGPGFTFSDRVAAARDVVRTLLAVGPASSVDLNDTAYLVDSLALLLPV